MYGIFTYIWAMFGVNVGKYSIHGSYGYVLMYGRLMLTKLGFLLMVNVTAYMAYMDIWVWGFPMSYRGTPKNHPIGCEVD